MKQDLTDFTFLTKEQLFGNQQLEVLKKYGMKAAITDFSVVLGGGYSTNDCFSPEGNNLEHRAGWYWSSSPYYGADDVLAVGRDGSDQWRNSYKRNGCGRPALLYSDIFLLSPNVTRGTNGIAEIDYGEYPQTAVPEELAEILERALNSRVLKKTGKKYTTDSRIYDDQTNKFKPRTHSEYEYNGKKYIRVVFINNDTKTLSNGKDVAKNDAVWIEVEPIRWLVDERTKIILSKKLIFSGVRYNRRDKYNTNFRKTEIKKFMDSYFSKDILTPKTSGQEEKKNPYDFDFRGVSEEDIIRGAIESGVSVFLHGQSGEGKSARVKQLDPDAEIIYLRNATPDSLNGKSVYNQETGEMIDVPPTWYKKLVEKCDRQPHKIHIVFFDEITNALPAIQGMVYNIILCKEVNGIWKLPENARIVAAGNDYIDSIAANQLAEPLFNRFAHVYINTSVEDWLKWAMTADIPRERLDAENKKQEHKIHPAVYAYIAFKRESALRSPYTGEKPNADPRKWEMASALLYKTGQPEMLRALVGDEITKDFVRFCTQRVLTLEDVVADRYSDSDLDMSTDEKWATTVGLSYANEKDVEKVRGFVSRLEPELVAIFDSLWIHGNEKRMERIAELRFIEAESGGYAPQA